MACGKIRFKVTSQVCRNRKGELTMSRDEKIFLILLLIHTKVIQKNERHDRVVTILAL